MVGFFISIDHQNGALQNNSITCSRDSNARTLPPHWRRAEVWPFGAHRTLCPRVWACVCGFGKNIFHSVKDKGLEKPTMKRSVGTAQNIEGIVLYKPTKEANGPMYEYIRVCGCVVYRFASIPWATQSIRAECDTASRCKSAPNPT